MLFGEVVGNSVPFLIEDLNLLFSCRRPMSERGIAIGWGQLLHVLFRAKPPLWAWGKAQRRQSQGKRTVSCSRTLVLKPTFFFVSFSRSWIPIAHLLSLSACKITRVCVDPYKHSFAQCQKDGYTRVLPSTIFMTQMKVADPVFRERKKYGSCYESATGNPPPPRLQFFVDSLQPFIEGGTRGCYAKNGDTHIFLFRIERERERERK